LQSYVDSYHGLKSRAGDQTVANCASCHGAHRILPHTDPTSSIYPANLQKTCGNCHPGISAAIASTPIHGTPGVTRTPAARIFRLIYIIAIVLIIGTMIIHWLIDLRKQVKNVLDRKQVVRMTYGELWQHVFLMITFITLIITGFALRFSEAWWAVLLFGHEGGFPLRGVIHRVAAVLFIFTVIWHVIYLTTGRGRRYFKDIFPAAHDFAQFMQTIKFNLGISKESPRFGRFSYVEKAEYWALVWGSVVMIFSGFFLWFENYAARWFAKGFLDVMLIIHYYEAWLAALAVLIWHMYSTVFSPSVYPMNPSWLNGKMPEEMLRHEHPEDPSIKGKAEQSPTE
jgi:formate dehydrogenase gamma subunit